MSKTLVIDPGPNVVETVVSMLDLTATDLSRTAIVFPGKRPSHFVRKAIAGKLQTSFIPPKLFAIDEFITSLYRQLHPTPLKRLESIDAVALLFQIHENLTERIGGPAFETLDGFLPVGLKLFGELEELRIANVGERAIAEGLSGLTYARLHALPEYYRQFYRLVSDRGFVTRSMQYAGVAEQCHTIDLSAFTSVILTGFLALTNSERQILTELRRRENITCVFQRGKGMTDHFKKLLGDQESLGSDENESQPDITFCQSQDTHGQVFALSTLMKEKLERREEIDENTVVVLPTADALFPVYHQTLPLFEQDQYNIALGYPLSRTPIYSFVDSLMGLVGTVQQKRFPVSAYLKFILHPYTKNIRFGQRSDVTRILVHKLEELLARDKSKMYTSLEKIESLIDTLAGISAGPADPEEEFSPDELKKHLVSIHDRTIRQFASFESIGDFARKTIDILFYIYDVSTANRHPMFRAYSETMVEMFHGLAASLISSQTFHNTQAYFNFLRRYIEMCEVPFSGTPVKGLQVLGLLETRNLLFEDVYVLDVNDDILPGRDAQEMLLPQGLREKLGLETRRDRERLTEYYFGLLINGARKVYLFFSEHDSSEKSRFVEKLLWKRQQQSGMEAAKKSIRSIRYNVILANSAPAEIPKSADVAVFLRNLPFSASSLDVYLQCPIKFFYSRVLKLEEREDASEDIDNRDIGKLVHDILREYFRQVVGKQLSVDALDADRMKRTVGEMFKQSFGAENAGALYLIKRQIERQMDAFLRDYQKPILESSRIVIEELEYSISTRTKGFNIVGRIDRIERRGADTFILDYKTGKDDSYARVNFKKLDLEDRATWGKAISSLQLPFYMLLYTLKNGSDVRRVRPAYVFLGRHPLNVEIETEFSADPEERAEYFRISGEIIVRLMEEIADASKPFLPTAELQKHCPTCPFSVLCGTQWMQGWKA